MSDALLSSHPMMLSSTIHTVSSKTNRLARLSANLKGSSMAMIEDEQKTVIAIAHRLSTLQDLERIFVLDQGKIIEQGTHTSLLQQPHSFYQQLWQHQRIG